MKESIVESNGYETLTIDELYSKLKASEVDAQAQSRMSEPTPKSLALMSGPSSSDVANANPSVGYALSLISAKLQCYECGKTDHFITDCT